MQVPSEASKIAVETLRAGSKILLCGNGGSAADAQHIAAELTGTDKMKRRGLPGIYTYNRYKCINSYWK